MQCSECRTELPTGAAYCPTCGSITPFHVSSSGVSPSDTTVASSPYAESLPNPYTPNPYTTPPPPPPPPAHRGRPSVGGIVLLLVLLLLIVGAGGILYFRTIPPARQLQAHASPTVPAQQVTPTPSPTSVQPTATPASAQTPQDLYDQVTQRPPTLDSSLSANDTSNWTERTSGDNKYSCAFSGGAYHAIAPQNAYMLCLAQAPNFGDLTYQVQMTIVKGEFGGMAFRVDSSQTKYYSFLIDSSGTYSLITSVDNTGTRDYVVQKGTSAFFKTGLNQVNLIAVIARGSNIYLYINQHYVISASDNRYRSGQIGLFGGDYTKAPADVVFSHVQIWQL